MSVIVGRLDGNQMRLIDTHAAASGSDKRKISAGEPAARNSERATNLDQLGLHPYAYWTMQRRLLERNPEPKHAPTAKERFIDAEIAIEFARDEHNGPTPSSSKMIKEAFECIRQVPADIERTGLWMKAHEVCKQARLGSLAAEALRGALEDIQSVKDHHLAWETPEKRLELLREVAREMQVLRLKEAGEVIVTANSLSYQALDQLTELRRNAQLAAELGMGQMTRQTFALLHQRAMELDAPHGHLSTRLRSWGEEMWTFYGQPLLRKIINGTGSPHESTQ